MENNEDPETIDLRDSPVEYIPRKYTWKELMDQYIRIHNQEFDYNREIDDQADFLYTAFKIGIHDRGLTGAQIAYILTAFGKKLGITITGMTDD